MMNAPDRPWQIRPSISKVPPIAPDGASPTSSEPTIENPKPSISILTRPTLSARPPMTTMKMPENSAVIDTAMFMNDCSSCRSAAMVGAMFSVVWANSQNASTPRMIPNSNRSLPR